MTEGLRLVYTDGHGNPFWPRSFSAREDELLRIAAKGDRAQQLLDAHDDELYRQHAEDVGIERDIVVEVPPPLSSRLANDLALNPTAQARLGVHVAQARGEALRAHLEATYS